MRTQSETETPNCGSRRIVQVSLTKKKKEEESYLLSQRLTSIV